MKLVSVGDIGVDHYTNKNLLKPGGIAFNFASNAKDAGSEVSLVGAVGDDAYGTKLITLSTSMSIDISHVQVLPGNSARQNIELHAGGERKFAGYDPGVLRTWTLTPSDLTFIASQDAIFVPLNDGMEHIFHAVKDLETKAKKIADFSQDYEFADFDREENVITKFSPYFDIICIGATRKQLPMVKKLGKSYPEKIFVLTMGMEGSVGVAGTTLVHQEAISVAEVVDTTGCGDAFQAAFSVNYISSGNIHASLERAANQAAHVVGHIGSTLYSL